MSSPKPVKWASVADMALHVTIISPERRLYEGEAESVALPGVVGNFAVLKGHAPLVSELTAGEVVVLTPQGKKVYVVESGFAEIRNNKVTALVEGAVLPEEIDRNSVQQKLDQLLKKPVVGEEALQAKEREVLVLRARLRSAG